MFADDGFVALGVLGVLILAVHASTACSLEIVFTYLLIFLYIPSSCQ